MNTTKNRINFFDTSIDLLTMDETLQYIEKIIEERIVTQHVVVNVAKLVMMQRDAELRNVVNSCDLINADGQGVVWGARVLGLNIPERVAGIDLFLKVVELAAKKGYRLYFLGARQEIIERVVIRFLLKYPKLQIAGYRNGYFSKAEEAKIVEIIQNSRPHVLFVAMSSPQKEIFLNQYIENLQIPFMMGVGGSFDVVAGYTNRAPLWAQKAGLEWFFRLMCEPRRMWKRYLISNTIFAWMILKALFRKVLWVY